MKDPQHLVDPEALRRMEAVCRARVLADPVDTLARGRLAWCLFLQAVHQAGQESILEQLGITPLEVKAVGPRESFEDRQAQELLDECLRHTEAVLHLSAPGQQRTEMERLLGLARLSVGEPAFNSAEQKAHRILDTLIRDLKGPDTASGEANAG